MPLDDTGLVVRYYVDEADSGTGPTEVLDADRGDPFDLAITYDTGNYNADAGNRGLESTSTGSATRAQKNISDSSDKIRDNLEGGTTFTIEVVADIDGITANGSRTVHIGDKSSGANGELSMRMSSAQLQIAYNDSVYICNSNDTRGTRRTYHCVVDTTQAAAEERMRFYIDGSFFDFLSLATTPPSGQTLALQSQIELILLNRQASGPSYGRSIDGTVFYAAYYNVAFEEARASDHHDILSASDDTPVVIPSLVAPSAFYNESAIRVPPSFGTY